MGGILSSLNTSYTGLQAHQLMVDVTGNNISNASDEFYSRQRVIAKPEKPISYQDKNIGRGVEVESIQRIHNEFVFSRYSKAAQENEFYDTEFANLREASAYFPDVDGVGIYNDLEQYFNAWKDLAKNPKDPAQKQVLAKNTEVLVNNIRDTRSKLSTLQQKASEELKSTIKEVNNLGSQIAKINQRLKEMEDAKILKQANELRDRRDQLEFHLKELIGGNVSKSNIKTNSLNDKKVADFDDGYVLNIAHGFNIVDGTIFHPLVIENQNNSEYLNRIYFRGYDFKDVDITDKLDQGKTGALIGLYNSGYDGTKTGKLQNYINLLDSFAKGFIEANNAIYAQSASHEIESTQLEFENDEALKDTNYNIKNGTIDLIAYNTDGKEIAKKTIKINDITTMKDIVNAINANTDDNKDNNATNDFDDYFQAYFDNDSKKFYIQAKEPSKGFYVSLKDNGTNFTGALGLNAFFEGNNAQNIRLSTKYKNDPTYIRPWLAPISGNFDVANMMQQLQYEKVDFYNNKFNIQQMKLSEFYQYVSGKVATDTEKSQQTLDTKKSVFEAIKKEYLAISQVSIDEEMVNLIKFQGGYAANAKVITAIDRMIDTLLSIKQ
ncbi:flagellar hook-associated protein FlgK [Helicobacter sp. 12S02232-10]|uniref:flagellar hook-associated protein FlgK n=1 Tax=Helicobacter sp. 12S02232-10 TaxID=1476197 RepID=UPI000BA79436|nr:flagellar hook-associated protein FlgK [Helicobacter sp. 12S02232-10]PAF49968.1 flagellar hook-associated protein FlgK [Helicobacter sp. 12S02232-10]